MDKNALIPANIKPDWKEVVPSDNRPSVYSKTFDIRPRQEVTAGAVNHLLNAAADYLEKGGKWSQGGIGQDSSVCAVGALLRAESGDIDNVYNETQPFRHPVTSAAVAKLANHLDEIKAIPYFRQQQFDDLSFGAIATWNDADGRTKKEVVELFREAAKE